MKGSGDTVKVAGYRSHGGNNMMGQKQSHFSADEDKTSFEAFVFMNVIRYGIDVFL